jgi:hypothetical protein
MSGILGKKYLPFKALRFDTHYSKSNIEPEERVHLTFRLPPTLFDSAI